MKYPPAWKDRMDAKVRAIVHARGFCLRCGRTDFLTAAHIERRRFYGTRWDPDAILCLCLRCHTWFDAERTEAAAWLVGQIGQDAVDDIHTRRVLMPDVGEVESDLARRITPDRFAPSWRSRVAGDGDPGGVRLPRQGPQTHIIGSGKGP